VRLLVSAALVQEAGSDGLTPLALDELSLTTVLRELGK
jgi:hypothetical protein